MKGHEKLRYRPEHYLEAIHQLGEEATLTNIAKTMGVKPSTAKKMLEQLQAEGFVEYRGRRGVFLTEKGLSRVAQLDRVHRALADFFKAIGVEEELAESEAEKLEHVISPEVVEKVEKAAALIKLLKDLICNVAKEG
ncbi:MAG: metal-dependent transcriptional regulator [Pyrobaculum sp.]